MMDHSNIWMWRREGSRVGTIDDDALQNDNGGETK